MKLWLDDERPPPDDTWTWVKNAGQFVQSLMRLKLSYDAAGNIAGGEYTDKYEIISFDHDLGKCPNFDRDPCPEGTTCIHDGTWLVNWLEEQIHHEPTWPVPRLEVHSQNPVGIQRLKSAFASIEKHVKEREGK